MIKLRKLYIGRLRRCTFYKNVCILISSLDQWPNKVKIMQSNWIGKSIGAEINFNLTDKDQYIKIFTTRPDTIFGATFLAVSTDHPICENFKESNAFLKFRKLSK